MVLCKFKATTPAHFPYTSPCIIQSYTHSITSSTWIRSGFHYYYKKCTWYTISMIYPKYINCFHQTLHLDVHNSKYSSNIVCTLCYKVYKHECHLSQICLPKPLRQNSLKVLLPIGIPHTEDALASMGVFTHVVCLLPHELRVKTSLHPSPMFLLQPCKIWMSQAINQMVSTGVVVHDSSGMHSSVEIV
jgi:hypothetical protein